MATCGGPRLGPEHTKGSPPSGLSLMVSLCFALYEGRLEKLIKRRRRVFGSNNGVFWKYTRYVFCSYGWENVRWSRKGRQRKSK